MSNQPHTRTHHVEISSPQLFIYFDSLLSTPSPFYITCKFSHSYINKQLICVIYFLGTFAIVCLLTGDIIISLNKHIEFNMENAQTIAAICLVTGIYQVFIFFIKLTHNKILILYFQFIFYILQIGKLCQCLSETLINAFSVACACHIVTSQIADILGIKLRQKSGHFRIINVSNFSDLSTNDTHDINCSAASKSLFGQGRIGCFDRGL